jgi:hypothetical protein
MPVKVYNKGMTTDYSKIPYDTMETLEAWVKTGRPMGSFCQAVVSNDLKESVIRADDMNRQALPLIVMWLYWEAPSACWGSPEKMKAWPGEMRERVAALLGYDDGLSHAG